MNIAHRFGNFLLKTVKVFILSSVAVMGMFTTIVISMIVLVLFSAVAASAGSSETTTTDENVIYGDDSARTTFLAVDVNGVILGEPTDLTGFDSLFTEGLTYGYSVKEELMEAAEDDDIDGILLVVDSPGGTIYGSKAIADGIEYYRNQTGKPIIAYVAGMAASGGYWSAVAADYVVADYGTSIGSIGVIYGPFKYYDQVVAEDGGAFMGGVVTEGGVETTYITAGRSKDIGNPYRQITEQELAQLQESVNDSYNAFVAHVASERKLTQETVRNDLGAMIYSESQAQRLGMIDMVGSKHDAYDTLAKRATVKDNDYRIIRRSTTDDFFTSLFGAVTDRQPKSTTVVATPQCKLHSQVLAYHGSVDLLCP